jgi:hypothetical protein
VVYITAADENNQPLATSNESITRNVHDPNDAWAVSLNVSAKPRYIEPRVSAARVVSGESPLERH